MSILVTVLRVISEKLQNDDPKTCIIWTCLFVITVKVFFFFLLVSYFLFILCYCFSLCSQLVLLLLQLHHMIFH